jgi:hypothetical protein
VRETKSSSWLAGLTAWAEFIHFDCSQKLLAARPRNGVFRFFGKAHVGGYTIAQNLIGLHDFQTRLRSFESRLCNLAPYFPKPGITAVRETKSSSWLAGLTAWAEFIHFDCSQKLLAARPRNGVFSLFRKGACGGVHNGPKSDRASRFLNQAS